MRRDRPVTGVTIAFGAMFALLSLAAMEVSFPSSPGHAGGPGPYLMASPAAAIGGALLGEGLLRYTSRTGSRLLGLVLKFGLATAVMAVGLGYGVVVAPAFFDAEVVQSWLGIALVLTLVVVTVLEGVYQLSD